MTIVSSCYTRTQKKVIIKLIVSFITTSNPTVHSCLQYPCFQFKKVRLKIERFAVGWRCCTV